MAKEQGNENENSSLYHEIVSKREEVSNLFKNFNSFNVLSLFVVNIFTLN